MRERVAISEVCLINPKKSEVKNWPENTQVSFLGMKDVGEDGSYTIEEKRPLAEVYKGFTYFKSGDILFAKITPCMENGKGCVLGELDTSIGFGSTEFHVLRCNEKADNKFIGHLLKAPPFRKEAEKNMTGSAGQKRVPKSFFDEFKIPLPPLAEQKKIAALLDAADAYRQKTQALIGKYEALSQSLFLEMFGDPVTNPKGYDIRPLMDVSNKITDGVHAKPDYTETGIEFISVKNITKGFLNFENCKYVSKKAHEKYYKRCNPELHDILYTKVGATYGRPAIVNVDREFSLYVSVALIKPKKEIVHPYYLVAAMANPVVKRQADRSIKGIGVPDLHLNMIKKFVIPLPPMGEQIIFAERVQAIEAQKAQAEAELSKAEELFQSLLQRAFSSTE